MSRRPLLPGRRRDASGFTLIEVLLTIGVIAVIMVPVLAWTLTAFQRSNDNSVTATVGAAGTVGIGGTLTRDVNTNYETYPYVMTVDRATGMATGWRRLDLCRGDSVAATSLGSFLVTTIVEPRFCQPGTEPALRILLGDTRLSYVPGGLQSNVVATATTADGSLVLGGRFERLPGRDFRTSKHRNQ